MDCGAGGIFDELPGLGVRHIAWVLHTHHHRDQCSGAERAVAAGASLAVPEREAHLFAAVEGYWDGRHGTHRYDLATEHFALARSVPVTATLKDYETFGWRGHAFRVLPAPGHTKGSVMLVLPIDGRAVAFTGDLISDDGRLHSVPALQWAYGSGVGMLDGLQPLVHSLCQLRRERPQALLPSHGPIIERPEEAIQQLLSRLRSLVRFQEADANDLGMFGGPVGLASDRTLTQVSTHLWMNRNAFANCYFLTARNGKILILDYGYPTFHHFTAGFRFAEHSLLELRARGGGTQIDLVIPSHYHDDHVAGIPYLQRTTGARVWAHEVMVDILEHPTAYNLPCLLPEPIAVERALRDGERFEWEEYTFEIVHTPGHTHFHAALLFEVDGLRVAFTGDTLHSAPTGPILGGPIFGNRFAPGDFETSIDRLRAWGPQLLLTGHTGVAEVDDGWLQIGRERAREYSRQLEALMTARPAAGGFDPFPVNLRPYGLTAVPGAELRFTATVRGYGAGTTLTLRPCVPAGWEVHPRETELRVGPGGAGETDLLVRVPAHWSGPHVAVVLLDVTVSHGHKVYELGPIAEAVVRPAPPGPPEAAAEEAEELLGGVGHAVARTPSGGGSGP